MNQEIRRACFDIDLEIEAYSFEGIMQKFPNHFHEHYVVGFVEKGQRYLTCKNQEYTIYAGDLLIFNPLENHACEQVDNQSLDWRCINIEKDVMCNVASEISGKDYLPIFSSNVIRQSDMVYILREIHEMILNRNKDFKKEELFYFLIEQLISEYVRPVSKDIVPISKEIQLVCDYIENKYAENISLNDLGSLSNLNKYTLLRNFTMQKGITPYQYLSTIRVNKAQRLLELGISPIDAALQSGFTDQSHFTRFFKNFIGLTPKRYQRFFEEDKKTDGEME